MGDRKLPSRLTLGVAGVVLLVVAGGSSEARVAPRPPRRPKAVTHVLVPNPALLELDVPEPPAPAPANAHQNVTVNQHGSGTSSTTVNQTTNASSSSVVVSSASSQRGNEASGSEIKGSQDHWVGWPD